MKAQMSHIRYERLLDEIFAYEHGQLTDHEVVNLFQELIKNGMVWKLPPHYGQQALCLLADGYCHR